MKRVFVILVAAAIGAAGFAQPQYFAGTGHWYEGVLVPAGILWDEAQALAQSRGGYLACISNAAENTFATNLVASAAYYSDFSVHGDRLGPWIGGYHNADGVWHWVTGEPFTYTNWYPGQPDGYGGSLQKVQLYAGASFGPTWGDHPGTDISGYYRPRGYIIEYGTPPVSGQITLSDYLPAPAGGRLVTFTMLQGGATVDTKTLALSPGGAYSLQTTVTGNTTITAKASHWLTKTIGTFNLGASTVTGANATLTNGDCDGDNEITLVDYSLLSIAFGSVPGDGNWNPEADLDGDGEVTLADYAILSRNFGQSGD